MRTRTIRDLSLLWFAPVTLCLCMGQSCDVNIDLARVLAALAVAEGEQQPPLAIQCPAAVHGCAASDQTEVEVAVSVHVSRTGQTPLTVTWSLDGNVVSTENLPAETPLETDVTLTHTLALGTYTVHVEVNDGTNPVESCDIPVEVFVDEQPPEVTCSVAENTLWPPNHKLRHVGLSVEVADDCDLDPDVTVQVYSDEPVNGDGDGNTDEDAADVAPDTLQLRAERGGDGDGRVYLIVITVTDDLGQQDTTSCTVVVPHDRSADSIESVTAQAAAAQAAFDTDGHVPDGFVLLNP